MFHACLSSSSASLFVKFGGDALTYCSHWIKHFLNHCLLSSMADRWSQVDAWWHVAERSRALEPVQLLCKSPKSGACKTASPKEVLFWPWGICSKPDKSRTKLHTPLSHGDADRLHVALSQGDGVHGENVGTTCACATSLHLMALTGCQTQLLILCAIGCGETLKDTGSGVFCHGGELPHVFGLWFCQQFLVKLAMSRLHMGRPMYESWKVSGTRCSRPKCVTLENSFIHITNTFKPINAATWALTKILPHVLERKRPKASDHAATMTISMLWVSLAHVVKASFVNSKAGIQ